MGIFVFTDSNVSLLDAQRWMIAVITIHEAYTYVDIYLKPAGYRNKYLVH